MVKVKRLFSHLACVFLLVELQRVSSQNQHTKSVTEPKLHFDFHFDTSSNISKEVCNSQLTAYQYGLEQNVLWAQTMRDAWGNVPSGLLSGNYFDLGNFDQCIDASYYSSEVGEIAGQHCTLMIPYSLNVNMASKLTAPSRS